MHDSLQTPVLPGAGHLRDHQGRARRDAQQAGMGTKHACVPSMHGSDSGLSDVGARWVVGGGTVGGVPWVARSVVDTVIRWYGGRYGGTAGDTACCATRMYASDSVPWLGV